MNCLYYIIRLSIFVVLQPVVFRGMNNIKKAKFAYVGKIYIAKADMFI